ncbi:ring domain at very C-terminus of large protein [Cryptosporidium canis]|nr:ring domain at very C-terminus of large protein [Cryptosporidium canis]
MAKGKFKSSINSSKAISLLGESKAGVATSLWGIFSEFNVQSNSSDALHTNEQLNISSLHPSFVPMFTNMSKKDGLTRMKGLVLFKEELSLLLQSPNPELDWEPVLSNFTYIYIRIGVYDSDVKIRKLSNECLSLLHKIVGGRKLEKFCKLFFPALWLSCNDIKQDVSKSALECLDGLVRGDKSEKMVKLISFCFEPMFDLFGRLLSCNVKGIKGELNANVSSQSEEEELFDRIISISLSSICKVMKTLHGSSNSLASLCIASHLIFTSLPPGVNTLFENSNKYMFNTLQMGCLWKFISNNYSSVIRVEAILLLTYSISIIYDQFTQKSPEITDTFYDYIPSPPKAFTDSLKCLSDSSNSNVQTVSPRLVSAFSKLFPRIWKHGPCKLFGSPTKYFAKNLFMCLNNPNQISCHSLFSELPYIISYIPFEVLLGEFSNISNEVSLMKEIVKKTDFYFKSFNEFMVFLHESIKSNNLPILCLIPLGIISHLVKFSVDPNNDSSKIVLGTPNSTLLNCSLEAYYTILLHFLHKKFLSIDENLSQLREFLLEYYSKLIWTPIILSVTIEKAVSGSISSSVYYKAQFKINEQFSNMMIDSIKYHSWAIDQCKERNLDNCISNLNDFLTGYWTRLYMDQLNRDQSHPTGHFETQDSYRIVIFLEICSVLNKHDPEFVDNVLQWLRNTSNETFVYINLLDGNKSGNCEFETIISKLRLINKAITDVIIKPIYEEEESYQQVADLFLQIFEDFVQIVLKTPLDANYKKVHITYNVLENIFLPLILVTPNLKLSHSSVLEKMITVIHSNMDTFTFVTIESLLFKLLEANELFLSRTFIEVICRDLPPIKTDLLERISKMLVINRNNRLQVNNLNSNYRSTNLAHEKPHILDLQDFYINFFIALSETPLVKESRSLTDFLKGLIILLLKPAFETSSMSKLILSEMSQLKTLISNFTNNIDADSKEFIAELLYLLIYSNNDIWFEDLNALNVITPIVDSIYLKSHEIINSKYQDEMDKLSQVLLFQAFNIGDEINSSKLSDHKLALLVDRNLNGASNIPNYYNGRDGKYKFLFEGMVKILMCMTPLLTDKNACLKDDFFQTGFKIRKFIRIYSEVARPSSLEPRYDVLDDQNDSNISHWLIIYTLQHLFISGEANKLLLDSKELTLGNDIILHLFESNESVQENEGIKSLIHEFSEYLAINYINSVAHFKQIINSIWFSYDGDNTSESRLMMNLARDFFVYLFELIIDQENLSSMYISVITDHINSNFLERGSIPLFLALVQIKNKGISLPTTYTDISRRLLSDLEIELKEVSRTDHDYLRTSRLAMCIQPIIVELETLGEVETNMVCIISFIDDLTEELSKLNIVKELNVFGLYKLCNLLSTLIELLLEYLKVHIQDGVIQDNIELEYQYGSLEISKLMIKLSSTIHYLVGKVFEVSISEINNIKIANILDDYSVSIQNLVLSALRLSSNIYKRLDLNSDEEIPDDLRFTSITIQLETNILSTFDKFLGLFSTVLLSKNSTAVHVGLRIFLEQILLLRNSENVGEMWILAILESKLGTIKGNAMEISKLLTTNSLQLHSFVLLILKEHNWYNTQYEYPDLSSAIASIGRLDEFIREYLILKNEDDDLDDIEYQGQEDQLEFLQESFNPTMNNLETSVRPESSFSTSDFDSENFEKGIEVIASHWRRLVGPSLAQQLLETYFSTINITYYGQVEGMTSAEGVDQSKSLSSMLLDVSQRLGCWNFILPKLISEDFVICTDKENPNIQTIEKNLTPCIESLLELKPIVIGEAIKEKHIDLRSQTENDLLPSRLEDEDIAICQPLQYFVKGRNLSELLLDEMVLKDTTFSGLRELLDAPDVFSITQQTIKLSLIHVLVELSFQTLVILEDRIRIEETNQTIHGNSEDIINIQTNWVSLFRNSSNAERRKLLTASLEEVLQLDPKSNTGTMVWDSGNIFFTWLLATRIILSLTTYFPRILREIWQCNSNKKAQVILQKLVINYFSPTIIPIEFSHIPCIIDKISNTERKVTFDHNISSRTIKISYSERGFSATLSFTFSQHHPLVIPKVNIPNVVGISKKQNSNWLISVIKAVRYKNVTHAILTWVNNLSLYLDGIEDCLICYSIVHPQYRSLPRKRCNTCNNIFHSECIYKWFRTSNKATCPLCISIMH